MDRLGLRFGQHRRFDDAETEEEIVEQNLLYGIPADDYRIEHGEIAPGETMGRILNRYGVGAATVDRLDRAAKTDFPLDGIRAGNPYTVFIHEDSLNTPHLDYLVYERNASQYVVFGLHSADSVSVTLGEKPVSVRRQKKQATIDSSLWGAIMREQMPYALAAELEEIYQWSIDFFGIQKGDAFTVVYDERIIDTTAVGIGRLGRQIHPCRQGLLRHSVPSEQPYPILGRQRRQSAQATAQSAAQIFAHQFPFLQRTPAPDLQGLPSPPRCRLRRAEGGLPSVP